MRILITGASGHLGRRLVKAARQAGYRVYAWVSPLSAIPQDAGVHYSSVELTHPEHVADAFLTARPMVVIHAGAMSNIANCYRDPVMAFRVNAEATRQLVGLCVAGVSRLIYLSSDLVFDGSKGAYQEDDQPRPLSIYGKSKLDGERAVLHHPGHLVARLSWLVGLSTPERPLFLDQQITSLRQGQPISLFHDEWRTPLCVEATAQALVAFATTDVAGILHMGGPERLSRHQMGCILAKVLGVKEDLVQAMGQNEKKSPEQRPHDVSLNSSQWRRLMPDSAWPTYEQALREQLRLS